MLNGISFNHAAPSRLPGLTMRPSSFSFLLVADGISLKSFKSELKWNLSNFEKNIKRSVLKIKLREGHALRRVLTSF